MKLCTRFQKLPLLQSASVRPVPIQILTLFFLALTFSGCLPSKQPPLKIDYYFLDYNPPPASETAPLPVILTIDSFSSSPEYGTDKILYQEQEATLSAYTYHRWRATPADLVTYYLARDLQAMGSFQAVTSPAGHLTPTHHLEGVVDKFLEVDGDDHWQAVLALTVTITKDSEPDVSKQVLAQQSFKAQVRCAAKNPLAVSKAMASAMAEISSQINSLLVEKLR
jgi:ABC-type uncharacterized transport system auxiliary subunit